MNIALLSLIALFVAIVISCFSPINIGFLATVFAFIIGVFFAGMNVKAIVAGFPTSLFLILVGITLLFSQAKANGTLDKVAKLAVLAARGNSALLPLIFFVLPLILATIGPGNIAATALLAPVAMAIAGQVGISAFLMTVMVANGANAGAFSPFAPTGVIANGLVAKIGIPMNPWTEVYLPSLLAQSFVALLGYLIFGGLALWKKSGQGVDLAAIAGKPEPFEKHQILTLVGIAVLIVSAIFFKVDVGFGALTIAVILSLLGAADEEKAVKAMPWNTIMLVTGVTVLIEIMASTGGMELFTTLLARISTPGNVTGVIAFVTGVISAYSSSSGVVMPAFIPTVPGLIAKLHGGNPVAIVSSINVGAHLVDVSPLSTLGALCIAAAGAHEDKGKLFRNLLIYGLSMSVVGAAVCYLFFGILLG